MGKKQDMLALLDREQQENQALQAQQEEILNARQEAETAAQEAAHAQATQQLEQQLRDAQAEKVQETAGAWQDYQKETDRYGVRAEAQAQAGLSDSGYSESSRTALFSAYQSRVAAARQVYDQALGRYETAMAQARQQNDAALAQIAYETLQAQLELTAQGLKKQQALERERLQWQYKSSGGGSGSQAAGSDGPAEPTGPDSAADPLAANRFRASLTLTEEQARKMYGSWEDYEQAMLDQAVSQGSMTREQAQAYRRDQQELTQKKMEQASRERVKRFTDSLYMNEDKARRMYGSWEGYVDTMIDDALGSGMIIASDVPKIRQARTDAIAQKAATAAQQRINRFRATLNPNSELARHLYGSYEAYVQTMVRQALAERTLTQEEAMEIYRLYGIS